MFEIKANNKKYSEEIVHYEKVAQFTHVCKTETYKCIKKYLAFIPL